MPISPFHLLLSAVLSFPASHVGIPQSLTGFRVDHAPGTPVSGPKGGSAPQPPAPPVVRAPVLTGPADPLDDDSDGYPDAGLLAVRPALPNPAN